MKSDKYQCLGYEIDFANILRRIIRQMDSTIRKRQEKLIKMSNPDTTSAAAAPSLEKIAFLQEQIDQKSQEAELLGSEGKMTEACQLMDEIAKIEEEKKQSENVIINLQQESEKKQRICEICGAYLVIGDPQHRLDEHLKGKLHSGAYKIREYLKNYDKIEEFLQEKLRNFGEHESSSSSRYHRSSSDRDRSKSHRSYSDRSDSHSRRHHDHHHHSHHRHSRSKSRSQHKNRTPPYENDSSVIDIRPTMRQDSPEAGELRYSAENYDGRISSNKKYSYYNTNYSSSKYDVARVRKSRSPSRKCDSHEKNVDKKNHENRKRHSEREDSHYYSSSSSRHKNYDSRRSNLNEKSHDSFQSLNSHRHQSDNNMNITKSSHKITNDNHDFVQYGQKKSKYNDQSQNNNDNIISKIDYDNDYSRNFKSKENPCSSYKSDDKISMNVKSKDQKINDDKNNSKIKKDSFKINDHMDQQQSKEMGLSKKTVDLDQLAKDVKLDLTEKLSESNQNHEKLKSRERKSISSHRIKDPSSTNLEYLIKDIQSENNIDDKSKNKILNSESNSSKIYNTSNSNDKTINMVDWVSD